MQAQLSCRPVVWTPDGTVVVAGPAAPVFAIRRHAPVFNGPFFAARDRVHYHAIVAWTEIQNALTPQASALDQSRVSAAPSSLRSKFLRADITQHMRKFYESAVKLCPHDMSPLDAALGLTEAFFACKGERCRRSFRKKETL